MPYNEKHRAAMYCRIGNAEQLTPRTAIYCRVACKDDWALEQQRLILRRYAETLGHLDCIEYLDNGVSGLSLIRPSFSQMTADIRAGHISAVIVKNAARISRNMIDFYSWLDEVDKLGVVVITVNDGILEALGKEKSRLRSILAQSGMF